MSLNDIAGGWKDEAYIVVPKQSNEQNQEPKLPTGLVQLALRALPASITRLDQCTAVTEAELWKLFRMGPNAIQVLPAALNHKEQSFAEPSK